MSESDLDLAFKTPPKSLEKEFTTYRWTFPDDCFSLALAPVSCTDAERMASKSAVVSHASRFILPGTAALLLRRRRVVQPISGKFAHHPKHSGWHNGRFRITHCSSFSQMSVSKRNNINIVGTGSKTMLFAHGYGCDQIMWRHFVPAFQDDYRIVLFDHVGAGRSDISQYTREKYSTLEGYADDVLEIIDAVCGAPVIFIGHSVSAMIGVLAAKKRPEAFDHLIMIGPSPCYINDNDYIGGFEKSDIQSLLQTLAENHLGWSRAMAPVIMKNEDRPELANELADSFCRTDPEIAKHFARVTFLSDNREDLASVSVPSLILQCSEDSIAPLEVGDFMHRNVPGSTLVRLRATGHCPHLSGPAETMAIIKEYLSRA